MQGKRKVTAEEHPGLYMIERYLHTERDPERRKEISTKPNALQVLRILLDTDRRT